MTIVTKSLTDEKKDLKPLVLDSDTVKYPVVAGAGATAGDDSSGSHISVYQHPYRKHRTGFLVCLALLILLTVACAVMGGIYLYYRFSQPEGYRGSCRIRFQSNPNPEPADSSMMSPWQQQSLQQQKQSPLFSTQDLLSPDFQPVRSRPRSRPSPLAQDLSLASDDDLDIKRIMDSFQQDFELDLRKQLWEILQVPRVPQLGLGRPARFIHDFSLNLTAIFDMQSRECYLMPLNRSIIKPPQDLLEFLKGLEDGSYAVDGNAVRQTYYVDPLPVMDYAPLGPFINRECGRFPTYWLITRDDDDSISDRVRRSLPTQDNIQHVTFGEFAGNGLHTVKIIKAGS